MTIPPRFSYRPAGVAILKPIVDEDKLPQFPIRLLNEATSRSSFMFKTLDPDVDERGSDVLAETIDYMTVRD